MLFSAEFWWGATGGVEKGRYFVPFGPPQKIAKKHGPFDPGNAQSSESCVKNTPCFLFSELTIVISVVNKYLA
jgi:hypothetical protein